MRIGHLLTSQDLLILDEAKTVLDAARAMTARKVGAVLVTTPDGGLAGIFTERDLMARVVVPGREPARVALRDVMTRDVFSVGPDDEVAHVRGELQRRHIRHLPVVVDDRVVGILSLRDILRADIDQMSHDVEELERYFLGGPEVR